MLLLSKTKIDAIGRRICTDDSLSENEIYENSIIDIWRQAHLAPLTEVTLKLQEWLLEVSPSVSIAQRLKRKPQIIRKLRRSYPMRLSQMQDIGGCRAIFNSNEEIDRAREIIYKKSRHKFLTIISESDYRVNARPESGYRALHIICDRNGYKTEIQLRTHIQHAWAEEIERTSIVCQTHLKEGNGPYEVLDYFKKVSSLFNQYETVGRVDVAGLIDIKGVKEGIKSMIADNRTHGLEVNYKFIKGMQEKEKRIKSRSKMNNWLLIFNWQEGTFQHWVDIQRKPKEAAEQYSYFEKNWPFDNGFEVVMIGARSISTIAKTHSHYFGNNTFDTYLATIGTSEGNSISSEAISVLQKLYRKDCWGARKISIDTVKNHYCKGIENVTDSLKELSEAGFITGNLKKGPISLNISMKNKIEEICA